MKLAALTWSRYRVPFREAFRTAHGILSHRCGVLVTVRTDDGSMGWGEIAPLPEQSGQSLDESLNALSRLVHILQGRELSALLHFLKAQTADEQLPAPLICGLETALLDAYGRANHLRLAELLAEDTLIGEDGARMPVQTRVPVNAVIGGVTSEAAVSSARAARAAGFTCFKLKLPDASPQMLERIAAIRTVIGPTARLRLDANGGWQRQQARDLLTRCAVYDIEYIEQPLPAHDLEGMASLRLVSPIPLAVDEALTGLASGRRILQACAADILILKPQLAGGPRICRRIIQEARSQGVDCVITSTLETGVGVATALHLAAASPEIEHPCGLATLNLLESDLLQSGLSLHQDTLELPSGPGLGVHPDQAALFYFRDEKTNGDER